MYVPTISAYSACEMERPEHCPCSSSRSSSWSSSTSPKTHRVERGVTLEWHVRATAHKLQHTTATVDASTAVCRSTLPSPSHMCGCKLKPFYRRALEGLERTLGRNHLYTLSSATPLRDSLTGRK